MSVDTHKQQYVQLALEDFPDHAHSPPCMIFYVFINIQSTTCCEGDYAGRLKTIAQWLMVLKGATDIIFD